MFSWIKRRPKWVKAIAVAALLFLGWAGWTVWGVIWQQPNPSVDYIAEINELVRSSQPEGENAWPIYRDLIVNELGYDGVTNLGNAKWEALSGDEIGELVFGEWDDARHDERKAQLESCAPLLVKLDEAADKPVFSMPLVNGGSMFVPKPNVGPPSMLISAILELMPELSPMGRIAKLNSAAMRAAAESSDWAGVLHRFRTGLSMGEQLTHQAMIIEHLYGMSMMALPLFELAHEMQEHDLPINVCESLLIELARLPWSRSNTMERGFEGEVRILKDMVQWFYTDDGAGDGVLLVNIADRYWHLDPPTQPTHTGLHFDNLRKLLFEPSRRTTMAMIEDWRLTVLGMTNMPPNELSQVEHDFYDRYPDNRVLRNFIPSSVHSMRQYAFFESYLAGTGVMLRLEMYHERTGDWPTVLTDAMSDAEARDPVSGEMFAYELTPDDEAGRAYELRVPWDEPDQPSAIINPPREPLEEDLLSDESDEE